MSLRKLLNATATIATVALTLTIGATPATAAPVLTTPISLPSDSDPISIAFSPDGTKAYVANNNKDTVSVISVATGAVTTISMPSQSSPTSVAFSRDGTKAYVTTNDDNKVSVITVATGRVTSTISLPALSYPKSVAISPDGTKAYVANYGTSSVSVITVANNTLGTPIVLPGDMYPKSVAFSPDGTKAYVADYVSSKVSVISVASGTVTSTISLPANSYPTSIAFSPDGTKAYVSHLRRSSVSVITVATGAVTSTDSLPTGYQWESVAFSPDGKQAFVAGFNWTTSVGTVALITVASNAVTSEILLPGASKPKSVAFSPDGTKAFVGNSGTATVSVISLSSPSITTAPTPVISGIVKVGNTLTVAAGTAPEGATVKGYQWSRATTATGVFENISDATSSTYALTASDVAKFIRVTVTWQKSDYDDTPKTSATTVAVVAGTFATPPVPTITGTVKVGETLTAVPGTWSPLTDSYTYVWSSSAKATGTYAAISGATGRTYELTSTDRGKFVKVTVTGVKSGYTSTPSLSAATTAVVAAFTTAPTPTITGTVRVGQTLRAAPGTWSPVATLTYQWKRDGSNISGATTATYLLTSADQGAAISVVVTGAALTYETTTKTSDSTEAVARGVFTTAPTPTITGTAVSTGTLTAVPGTWSPVATFTYRWFADGEVIAGQAAVTLPSSSMATVVGKQITVEVTGAATGYTSQAKTSAATAAVTLPLIATAPIPTISGTVKFGNTLTAVPGVVPSGATVKGYQWSRATTATGVFENITDATSSTYALTASDVTKFIRVTVTWQKSGSGDTPKTSATTVAVVAGTFATPLPIPTISGTKAVGQTLTANPGTWTPAVDSSTYTWWRANTATGKYATIAGATTATYALQSADLGKFIKVTVTGTKAGYTTITSGLSAATTVIVAG